MRKSVSFSVWTQKMGKIEMIRTSSFLILKIENMCFLSPSLSGRLEYCMGGTLTQTNGKWYY